MNIMQLQLIASKKITYCHHYKRIRAQNSTSNLIPTKLSWVVIMLSSLIYSTTIVSFIIHKLNNMIK